MAYTLDFSLSLGSSKTGLTMAAQLVDTSGSNVGSEVTSGFTEIGTGFYLWHYASIPDDHRGGVKFYEDGVAGTILGFAAINPEEGEHLDQQLTTLFTTALTEAYATDGSAATLAQAIYMIMQFHNERVHDGDAGTLSVKKLDGSTEAMSFTIDNDSITRAS